MRLTIHIIMIEAEFIFVVVRSITQSIQSQEMTLNSVISKYVTNMLLYNAVTNKAPLHGLLHRKACK